MVFPESPRVIYQRNPLAEVVCQLRFPAILGITAEAPARFQEAIRDRYPVLQVRSANPLVNFGSAVPPDLLNALSKSLPGSTPALYDFSSADSAWRVTLAQDFLALTATRYERWEGFKDHLAIAVSALEETYRPAFYTRIGLRYRDLVTRSALKLGDVAWKELLKPHVLGVLATDRANETQSTFSDTLISLAEAGQVRLRHGLSDQDGEQCYIIDADFSVENRTEIKNATKALDALNLQSGRLFRWCIGDRLHSAMGPDEA